MSSRATPSKRSEILQAFSRATREFFRNSGLDSAASLSYFMVLALFPGVLALVSLLALVGASQGATQWILDVMHQALDPQGEGELGQDAQQILGMSEQLLTGLAAETNGTTLTILIGVAGALWSTSGYVNAFSRAMNRLYKVQEGRPQWKRRPQMMGITLLIMIVMVVSFTLLVTSGQVAQAIGNMIGMGEQFVVLLNWLKPPTMFVMALLVVALLYHLTPNVKRPRFKWFSAGTISALAVLGLSVVGFSIYISRFASFSATYGAIGGVIILVIACWISNMALLMGAIVDIEFARLAQLRQGIAADEELQYPVRDDSLFAKKELSNFKDLVGAQQIRIDHGGDPLLTTTSAPDPKGKSTLNRNTVVVIAAGITAWFGIRRWSINRANSGGGRKSDDPQQARDRQP
ncbi:YihY/virulence factor BrkB family protein [Glutamicibacter sp. MNS18]|uniref:YihY/virulence factor BrkB family protein n=1 Tax=Glutamicibacter sp. MNS18 TaxID=2989817 RepID=UPI00223678C7|nr:YihY/virulence factor BrkB family protein [Glutamicibacter sp. MNS18]MCW4466432.1 YihY/virulence factor BrkB family protein [Glutamicibacter sp. MNS18]